MAATPTAPPEEEEAEEKEETRTQKAIKLTLWIIFHIFIISLLIWATIYYINFDHRKCPDNEDVPANATVATPIQCEFNWCIGYGFYLLLVVFFYIFFFYYVVVKRFFGQKIYDSVLEPAHDKWMEFSRRIIVSAVLLVIVIIVVLVVIVIESWYQLEKAIGVCGPILFIGTGFIFSKFPRKIAWRLVVTGLFLQFLLGLVFIRWDFGRKILECAGKKITQFLNFTVAGSLFVYGQDIVDHFVFAFAILAVIFFFSVVISILYYWGVMQAVLRVLGWLIQSVMGTTVCESVNAAGNIFLGMTESPLMIRPYIAQLTASEIHAVMVAGFATAAGTVFGAYISFGANPAYLITASIMAAPASLAFAKLYYPETEESQTSSDTIKLDKSPDTSVLDAASSGAANGVMMVLGIVSNIVAFIAIVEFLNTVVQWLFELGGLQNVTFMLILTYVFMPLVFLMGVPWKDCYVIGKVVATKTIVNEFVAYSDLGIVGEDGSVDRRSIGIATFAICGFANPGSLGILVAALCILAPEKRSVVTSVAIRAFVAGCVVCFTSASWAG